MPDSNSGVYESEPLIHAKIVTDDVTGNAVTFTWPMMQESIFQQARVWEMWAGTGSSVTCGTSSSVTVPWTSVRTTNAETNITFTEQLTTAASNVWGMDTWQNAVHSEARWTPTVCDALPKYVRTPEELAAEYAKRELQRQQRVRMDVKRKRFKEAADTRARNLLMSMLTPEQQTEMDDKNRFHLTVYDRDGSHRVYRIDYGYAGNVKLLGPNGKPVKRYCIHADSRLPKEDQMLAQKLLLENDEENFLRIANMSHCAA